MKWNVGRGQQGGWLRFVFVGQHCADLTVVTDTVCVCRGALC